jgi:hypothetical protein
LPKRSLSEEGSEIARELLIIFRSTRDDVYARAWCRRNLAIDLFGDPEISLTNEERRPAAPVVPQPPKEKPLPPGWDQWKPTPDDMALFAQMAPVEEAPPIERKGNLRQRRARVAASLPRKSLRELSGDSSQTSGVLSGGQKKRGH